MGWTIEFDTAFGFVELGFLNVDFVRLTELKRSIAACSLIRSFISIFVPLRRKCLTHAVQGVVVSGRRLLMDTDHALDIDSTVLILGLEMDMGCLIEKSPIWIHV